MDAPLCNDPTHADLLAKVERLTAQVAKLMQRVEELEARLKRDSSNSSRPPSSDPPWRKRPAGPRTPSGRKPGGQPGHEGTTRQQFDTSAIAETQDVRPGACPCCGSTELEATGEEPFRHQVVEIPKIEPHVVEHRLHAMRCRKCGGRVVAALPPQVPRENFGPRCQAMVAYVSGVARQSKRETQRIFDELLGVKLGLGTIPTIERRMSAALYLTYKEAQRALREGALAHVDETPWREARRPAWLWIATDRVLSVFRVDRRRSRAAYRRLFAGIFRGFLAADRLAVYDKHPRERRLACNAHLLRDFEGFVAGPRGHRAFGRQGRKILWRLFGLWHRFREGLLDRTSLTAKMEQVRTRLVALLEGASTHASTRIRNFASYLRARIDAVFNFLKDPELLEPSNNPAERGLRKAVLWRKSSYGTASAAGSRFVERMLTVSESLRAQGRGVLDFLTDALVAHASGLPPPSLLPARAE